MSWNRSPLFSATAILPRASLVLSFATGLALSGILDDTAMTLQTMTFSTGGSPLPYIGCGRWIGNDHVVAADWSGTLEEWSKDASQPKGPFSITRTWEMPGQPLGISVAPDGQSFVVGGSFGFVFLPAY